MVIWRILNDRRVLKPLPVTLLQAFFILVVGVSYLMFSAGQGTPLIGCIIIASIAGLKRLAGAFRAEVRYWIYLAKNKPQAKRVKFENPYS